jgi:hypothetical protein
MRRRTGSPSGEAKTVSLGALVLIAVIAAIAGAWYTLSGPSRPDAEAGRVVAEAFLAELEAGRPEAAWEGTSAEFKSALGRESFAAEARGLKFLRTKLVFDSVQEVDVFGESRPEFVFKAGTGETLRLLLAREGEAWKVDRWVH